MNKQSVPIKEYTPVFSFIAVSFLFEILHVNRFTGTFWAVIASWLTYMTEVKILLGEIRPGRKMRLAIQKRMGYITLVIVLVFSAALAGWLRWLGNTTGLIVLMGTVLIYFIFLFNAIHFNRTVKEKVSSK